MAMLMAMAAFRVMEAVAFEGQDHLMNRRWSDAEVSLHVGFGRR
jgi:hypothetical protein